MAVPDNHSEDPRTTKDDLIKPENSRSGPTRLALTLLIVGLIVATAIVSVYRNEVVSTIRRVSSSLFTVGQPGHMAEVASDQKNISAPSPGVSLVAPSAPSAEVKPDNREKLGLLTETSRNTEPPKFGITGSSQDVKPNEPKSLNSNHEEASSVKSGPASSSQSASTPDTGVKPTEGGSVSSPPSLVKPNDSSQGIPEPRGKTPEVGKAGSGAQTSTAKPETGATPSVEKSGKASVSEEFHLPGSIRVQIHNYTGALTKWALMVIVDNSDVMSRESKNWNPARIKIAREAVLVVSEAVGSGSRIALKDFSCKSNSDKEKGPCPIHTVYDWSEHPFKGFKEKLNSLGVGKLTNPCGAVINSIKKDFVSVGSGVPRLLLVTCGQAKCPTKDTLKVLNRQSPGTKVTVDVLALGIPSKRHATYSVLAKKSGGLFLAIETPEQLDAAMVRYKKALRTSTFEKIEIRNDKATVSVPPDEDMALAPGVYTIVLPRIKGLADTHRSIPNVKIKSGHATLIDVNPKKGKATIKVVDKQRSGS